MAWLLPYTYFWIDDLVIFLLVEALQREQLNVLLNKENNKLGLIKILEV